MVSAAARDPTLASVRFSRSGESGPFRPALVRSQSRDLSAARAELTARSHLGGDHAVWQCGCSVVELESCRADVPSARGPVAAAVVGQVGESRAGMVGRYGESNQSRPLHWSRSTDDFNPFCDVQMLTVIGPIQNKAPYSFYGTSRSSRKLARAPDDALLLHPCSFQDPVRPGVGSPMELRTTLPGTGPPTPLAILSHSPPVATVLAC